MNLSQILDELRHERDRIDNAITALENVAGKAATGGGRNQGGGRRRRRRLTPEGRKRLSEMMKKRWAERKRRARAA